MGIFKRNNFNAEPNNQSGLAEMALQNIHDGVIITDKNGVIQFINPNGLNNYLIDDCILISFLLSLICQSSHCISCMGCIAFVSDDTGTDKAASSRSFSYAVDCNSSCHEIYCIYYVNLIFFDLHRLQSENKPHTNQRNLHVFD